MKATLSILAVLGVVLSCGPSRQAFPTARQATDEKPRTPLTLEQVKATPLVEVALWEQMGEAHKDRVKFGKGRVVVGRVQLEEGKEDPRRVFAQMPILEGGYFADLIADPKAPLGFALDGYETVRVLPPPPLPGEDQDDLGVVRLKKVPKARAAGFRARIRSATGGPLAGVTATVRIADIPKNTVHPGPRTGTSDGALTLLSDAKGMIELKERLTPGPHRLVLSADGLATWTHVVMLEPGQQRQMRDIVLARPRALRLRFRVSGSRDFRQAETEAQELRSGEVFSSSTPSQPDLRFSQDEQGVWMEPPSYHAVNVVKVGPGSLEHYADAAPVETRPLPFESLLVSDGHTYLLHYPHWKRWVLFHVALDE